VMTTKRAQVWLDIPCAPATGKTLKSLPVGKDDKVVHRATGIVNGEYADIALPSKKVVLAPGQNPMAIEGTEDIRVSSMGFASDGCFHIRLEFAEGVLHGLCQRRLLPYPPGVRRRCEADVLGKWRLWADDLYLC